MTRTLIPICICSPYLAAHGKRTHLTEIPSQYRKSKRGEWSESETDSGLCLGNLLISQGTYGEFINF